MENRVLISKNREKYTKIKKKCYEQITQCTNKKVLTDSIRNIETTERIGLRGVNILINDGNVEITMGYKTNNTVIQELLIPIAKRYGLPKEAINMLEDKIQNKYIKGYRCNLSKLTRGLHDKGCKYLENKDRYGYLKARSYSYDIRYVMSSIGERKCMAYENRMKRLEKKEYKLIA